MDPTPDQVLDALTERYQQQQQAYEHAKAECAARIAELKSTLEQDVERLHNELKGEDTVQGENKARNCENEKITAFRGLYLQHPEQLYTMQRSRAHNWRITVLRKCTQHDDRSA